MRSVVVVFPASMWAMMPMFLQRSNGTVLGTTINSFWGSEISFWLLASSQKRVTSLLPPVMRERLVRFRHAMHVFFFLDGGAFSVRGVEQLVGQLLNHSLFAAAARVAYDPTDRQRRSAVGSNFNRHLVVRAAHTPGLYFQQRLGVLDRLGEQ